MMFKGDDMERISFDYWYVKENTLSISLMRFHVSIGMQQDGGNVFFALRVTDSYQSQFVFYFTNLEDAIWFTEEHIPKARSIAEIIAIYSELFFYKKDDKKLLRM